MPVGELKGQYPIVELVITGSERFDADDILRSTGLKQDKIIETPVDNVKAAAEKLLSSGAFLEVNYKHEAANGGMRVEFKLGDKDDDQFVKCDFANIVWMQESDLLVELHDRVPLFNGTVPRDGTLADDVAAALQALLKERGVSATITVDRSEATESEAAVVTYRAADVNIKVARVELTGASPTMKVEADAAAQKIVGLNYNRTTVARFIDHNLRSIYLQHGYLRVAMDTPAITTTNSGAETNVTLTVPVAEGKVYKAGTIRWTGNQAVPSKELDSYLHLAREAPLDGAQLAKDILKIRGYYATLGFLHMTLTPRPSFDEAGNIANYEMAVKEGDLFTMGKLEIEGLQELSIQRVRQAWKMREGDPFDPIFVRDFFRKFRLPQETSYIVEESEGDRPKSVDVTVIFCRPQDPCKPKNESHLYTPPPEEEKP